ncbi:radical SAM protein [Desulfofundulus thermobenzoicus]|uniref:Radical SAM protein n=1 Tax=Desulfofundulus thermobenzoicus TaxID=29376 RepID=A0A6N7IMF7_9FIRM|nr:radical SAM (seleno)protein TrsS [Desulfofundulus thermobenzoicus]MQL50787.1 radical SAM protein [Desulfofundulus thermobenzoicus]
MGERGNILSETESLCPECLGKIPAKRVARGDCVFLEKTCPEHGSFRTKIWEGQPSFQSWVRPKIPAAINVPFTEVDRGCPFDCGLCPAHRQHTCTALLEVTGRCHLKCTFCFADAGGSGPDPDQKTVRGWYQRLLDAGGPYNIQLSGGEPTLRDDLPALVALGRSMGFNFIQLNTNGLRLAREPEFLESLKDAGLASVFLQFDGTEREIHRQLRGGDFLEEKLEAVRLCGELGIGVILVPTVVPGINDHNLGQIIDLALDLLPVVRGVHFQPVSYFGRYPQPPSDAMRITLPEIIGRIERQTAGRIKAESFRPPGCENALCSFHGNFVLMPDGELVATTRHDPVRQERNCCGTPERAEEGARKARNFVSSRWSAPPPILKQQKCSCQCSREEQMTSKNSMDMFLERAKTHTLCLSAMAFQDVWNIDLERLKDCCIHTVAPDGRIIPFCAYNLTDRTGRSLYRGR